MLVITGIFEDERFIPDIPVSIPQKKKVTVTIEEHVAEASSTENKIETEEKNVKRYEAFNRFMQYKGILPIDFDYKEELANYRDERYAYWKQVIEPASPEESALIDEAIKEYDKDPSTFRPWEEIRRSV